MLTGKLVPKLPLVAAAALVVAAGILCFPLLHANPLTATTPMPLVQANGPQSDLLPQPLLDASFSGGFSLAVGGRTCRCSCGQPCKTDADCGPGGVCTAGITCCATPGKSSSLGTTGCPALPQRRS